MASGRRKLRQMQLGPEGTPGSAEAATAEWRGQVAGIEALDDIQMVPEDVGNFGDADRTSKVNVGAQIQVPETPFTFEQFPYFCEMGIKTVAGVQDGAGTDYIYTYAFPTTAEPTIKTYTVESGNNQKVYEMEYAFCPEFRISGAPNALVMMSGLLRGRQRSVSAFTSIATPAVDEAPFSQASLYLDAIGGTMGATELACSMLGFTINVNTGLVPIFAANGQLYFCSVDQVGWEVTVDVVFRHITGEDTEEANWLAQTARLLEIKVIGPAVATPGTDYSVKTAQFQFPGKWTKFNPLEDRDGNDIVTGTFTSRYDGVAAVGPSFIAVNELVTLV